jgi:hypothetical protein
MNYVFIGISAKISLQDSVMQFFPSYDIEELY